MRYPAEHKERTRTRIVRAASRRFRARGTEGAAIGDLMRDLRLTHGGFYRHFGSKDALAADAFAHALEESMRALTAVAERAPAGAGLEAIVDWYLAPDRCDRIADGCPVAALASEIARRPPAARATYVSALGHLARALASFMPGATDEVRLAQARLLFSGMPGTLTIARVLTDPRQRRRFLASARRFYVGAVRGFETLG